MSRTELDKHRDNAGRTREISEFLEWLEGQQLEICKLEEYAAGVFRVGITERPEQLVARYLGIDLQKLDQERRALLEEQRQLVEEDSRGNKR